MDFDMQNWYNLMISRLAQQLKILASFSLDINIGLNNE